MHRKITNEDILQYSLDSNKESIEALKEEDVEYKDGVLHYSAGNSTVVIVPSSSDSSKEQGKPSEDSSYDATKQLFKEVKAQSSYSMRLQSCSPTASYKGKRLSSNQNTAYSSLRAHVNKSKYFYCHIILKLNSPMHSHHN